MTHDPDRLSEGRLARAGLYGDAALDAARALIARVRAEGLETIRLVFADQHGLLRGKALVAEALPGAFRDGVAMTSTLLLKDTSHRTVFPVWRADAGFGPGVLTGAGDVVMVPDPASFRVLPWAPHSAWLLCDLRGPDLGEMPLCTRSRLRAAEAALADRGYRLNLGQEMEFGVFRVTEPYPGHAAGGMGGPAPETELLTRGYQYLTEARYDALEPVMDDLRRAAQGLGLPVRSMEVEFGPSQFEFTFDHGTPLAQADMAVLFRTMVRQVCARAGLHATFMCRPRLENTVPSGWHVHQSLCASGDGANLFTPGPDGALTDTASAWIAGLLAHAGDLCLLAVPTVNGYKRFQPGMLAPDRIQWGRDNKGAMIRALLRPGDRAARVENRMAEPAANPYLFFAGQIAAGLDGIASGRAAPPPVETPYDSDAPALPRALLAAIETWEASPLAAETFGPGFVRYLATLKRAEWERYLMAVSDWEQREYFALF